MTLCSYQSCGPTSVAIRTAEESLRLNSWRKKSGLELKGYWLVFKLDKDENANEYDEVRRCRRKKRSTGKSQDNAKVDLNIAS